VVVELHRVERKLAEGLSWCGEGWGELPTTASGSPEWRKGAAVVFGARVCAAREREGNGLSTICWCCWAEEGGKKSRRGRGIRQRRGGGRQELGWPWRSQKRTAGEGSRTGEGGGRRVESARAGGGAGEELERRWAVLTVGGRGKQRSRGAPEEEEERGGSERLICKNRKSRDLTVK
jgi:hypothetical protein